MPVHRSWKVQVHVGEWCDTLPLFDTMAHAEIYKTKTVGDWTLADGVQIVETEEPPSHTYTNGRLTPIPRKI